jgi:hypothetical protein
MGLEKRSDERSKGHYDCTQMNNIPPTEYEESSLRYHNNIIAYNVRTYNIKPFEALQHNMSQRPTRPTERTGGCSVQL